MLNLIFQVGIIGTGGAVRLTGSGLGCPSWPECVPGSYTPTIQQAEGFHKWIEFGNRTLSFVLAAAAIAVVIAVLRHPHRRRSLTVVGIIPLVLTVVQAVIGGITVWVDLHPLVVGLHFMVSAVIIAVSTVLWLMVRRAPDHWPHVHLLPTSVVPMKCAAAALATAATVVLFLGTLVTGSGPHSGDAEKPMRLQLNPKDLSWLHADVVLVFVGVLVAIGAIAWVANWGPAVKRWVIFTAAVTIVQGAIGYWQYFTGLPELLVGIHMVGAGLLTIAVSGLCFVIAQISKNRVHTAAPETSYSTQA